ncbi:MAG: ATP-binding protein [Lachnospiraceae bacterium]|nr:ATP-binding protein [Lachnospiraceae bacterium]
MALQNASYDKIQEEYLQIRRENDRLYEERLSGIYASHPELKEYDDKIADLLLKKAFCALNAGDDADLSGIAQTIPSGPAERQISPEEKEIDDEIVSVRAERESAAKAAGVDPSYLGRIYTCPYCHDTGYIEHEDGPAEKCRCFRKRESEILLKESGMSGMLDSNNFSVMRTDIFDGETKEHFLKAVEYCEGFINSFDTDYRNIMFCGTVGTGKSFLSSCIAKALLDTYHSVVYTSAKTLFDSLAEAQFSADRQPEADALRSRYYDCDLLIIDDLGTEMTNSFVGTELFTMINERYNARRSVIISTNLELPLLRDRYSDRIFSRLTGSYDILKLSGPDLRNII